MLKDNNGNHAVSWNIDLLGDQNNVEAMNWNLRQLIGTDGSTVVATWNDLFQLPLQGSGATPTCASNADNGKVALTSAYVMCVCNGSGWVTTADGSTSCTF